MIKPILFSTIFLLSVLSIFGQTAIRGILYDDSSGEPIPFADVVVQGTVNGTTTDLDGAYQINVPAGTYTLLFSYLGYADLIISDIEVKENDITVLDVRISEDSEQLSEIVVTAKQVRNTEAAIMTLQKKSVSFIDGLSSQTFSKTGDGDAAAAIKRVPGVSVEGGKYVYVRGLGDRYTKTILNGMDIPGLDPDRNTVQMDIFPTNIIDNIIVYKTFTPNLPGDFTGGMIEIITKDFPEQSTTNLSIGLGYNPNVHMSSNFVTYNGGKTDWLGIDDGGRELPFNKNTIVPDPTDRNNKHRLNTMTSQLNSTLATARKRQLMDRSFAFSHGNQLRQKKYTLGYNVALNYSTNYSFDDNAQFQNYRKHRNAEVFNMQDDGSRVGALGTESNSWSALGGLSIKFDRHKIGLTAMRNQNAESKAGEFLQENSPENPANIYLDVLQYSQREVTNFLLQGKHSLAGGKLTANWKLSPTFSRIYEPDIRSTAFELTEFGRYESRPAVGAGINRDWRELTEQNYSGKLDLTYEFDGIKKINSKLHVGGLYTYKNRDYEILSYNLLVKNQNSINFSGDQNEVMLAENLWTPESQNGVYLKGNFEPANTYQADQNLAAAYVMNELPLSHKLKAIYGVRMEMFQTRFTGQNNNGSEILDNKLVLYETDFLPSAALIFAVSEEMNVRASYANTLARPTFKEKSLVQITDRLSDRVFIGNLDLEETHIANYDLRWEYFFSPGQVVSLSAFYKMFDQPIELTVFDDLSPNNFTPRNVGDAQVYGIEFEARKSFDFLSIPNLSAQLNLAVVTSSVKMTDIERESRIENARVGETIDDSRDMAGQSPLLINAGLNYTKLESGVDINLNFNMQGERLSVVGIGNIPDVYEQPFESLNLKLSKKIGNKLKVSLSAQNLLDANREFLYKSFQAEDKLFSRFSPGRSFSFGLSYYFN
jgi:TonB-dependent receptor